MPPTPTPVPLPQKCIGISGSWSGDPHFRTFDGLRYDCQGEGEFHVLKSLESDLEIQGRFVKFRENARPTVTKSMAFKTGDGDPLIQVTTPDKPVDGKCLPHVHVDKVLTDIPHAEGLLIDGQVQIGHETQNNGALQGYIIYYHSSGVQATILAKKSSANGCVLSVKFCFPYTWSRTHERFVGLLGTPDKDKSNDWMKFDGTPVPVPTKKKDLRFKKSYDWCVEEFCIKKEEDSLFAYEDGESYDGFNNCYEGEDDETEKCVDDPHPDVAAVCGADDIECLVDGCVGGAEEAESFLTTVAELTDGDCGKEIYFENFDGPDAASWGELEQGNLQSKFLILGKERPADSFSKNVTVPTGADKVTIEFLFLEIGQWEGSGAGGHDTVLLRVGDTELDITKPRGFSKAKNADEELCGVKDGITWSRAPITDYNEEFGIKWNWKKEEKREVDQMHKVVVNVPQFHYESGELEFQFKVLLRGHYDDERAGVDDFRVTAYGVACDIPNMNGDDGLEYDKACGEQIIYENFDKGSSHSWGTIARSSGRSYLKMDNFSPAVIVSDAIYPANTEVIAIDFLTFKLGDWVGLCKAAVGNCGKSKIVAQLGTTTVDIKLDSFVQGGGKSTHGTVKGINWYRHVVTPGIMKIELHVPVDVFSHGAAAFKLALSGNEDDLGVGVDEVRAIAYSTKCYVPTARRHLLDKVMQPTLAVSSNTPWSRHLTMVDADDCTCVCPALLGTSESTGSSAPVVMNLYTSIAGQCDPQPPVVGTVTMITESDGTVTVTYDTDDGFSLLETNVYVGNERLPLGDTGEFLSVSEFPYSTSLSTSYNIDPLVCDFYVAAHAKVCGHFPQPPTTSPTVAPTNYPTTSPTVAPTNSPTPATTSPTVAPTNSPTPATTSPTVAPTNSPTPAPAGGSVFGDPHIQTWSGKEYDFHGGCDLVFLDNPSFHDGLGLTIHVRTKIVTWWSYIHTAVVRIGNETIEVTGEDKPQFFVNGVAEDHFAEEFLFSSFKTLVKRASAKQLKIRIDLENADALGLEVFKDFVRVNVKMKDMKWKKFEGSVGLMGRYPHGETVGRDGKTIFTDMNAFGQEWQVRVSEPKLFRSSDGPQHPTKCTMPKIVPTSKQREKAARRRLGESGISHDDAELACASVPTNSMKDCVLDVLATNDLEMAGSYL